MKRIFANIGFSFALTLIVINLTGIKSALAGICLAGAGFLFLISFRKTRKMLPVLICLASIAGASFVFCVNYYFSYLPQIELNGETLEAEVYIVDLEEHTSGESYSYTVKTKSISSPSSPQNIKLTVYCEEPLDYDYYEAFDAEISFYSFAKNGFESYGSYDDGIFLKGTLRSTGASKGEVFSVNKYVLLFREHLREIFKSKIDGDNGALALAVLTGDKCYLSTKAYYNFKSCGITHLTAVSGLHLSILTAFLVFLLKRLRVPNIPISVITAFVILFYIALSGFSKSMMRAGIMMLVLIIGGLFKKKSDGLNSLGFAAFLVCLNPFAVTDAGALLTFTAVIGLCAIRPRLARLFYVKNKYLRYFTDILLSTACVYITTFPVMYLMFGAVSTVVFIINLIAIPLTQVLLVFGLLFVFLNGVGIISPALVFVIRCVTQIMLDCADFFADFRYSCVNIDSPVYALAIAGVFIIFAVGFLNKKKNTVRICAIASALVFVFSVLTANLLDYNKTFVRTVSGRYSTCVIVYNREYCAVFGCREYNQYYTAQNIISSNSLSLILVAVQNANLYSASLAQRFSALNYSGVHSIEFPDKNINISTSPYFNVDLWQGFNVEYIYDSDIQTYNLTVEGTNLSFNSNDLKSSSQQDFIYKIDKNGYYLQGVSKWLS